MLRTHCLSYEVNLNDASHFGARQHLPTTLATFALLMVLCAPASSPTDKVALEGIGGTYENIPELDFSPVDVSQKLVITTLSQSCQMATNLLTGESVELGEGTD